MVFYRYDFWYSKILVHATTNTYIHTYCAMGPNILWRRTKNITIEQNVLLIPSLYLIKRFKGQSDIAVLEDKRAICQTFWKHEGCTKFLFLKLETSNFDYLLYFNCARMDNIDIIHFIRVPSLMFLIL